MYSICIIVEWLCAVYSVWQRVGMESVVMELIMWVLFVWLDSPGVVCAAEETWLYVHCTVCMHVHLIACVPAFIVPSMHVTSDCLCASIHYAFCTHTTSDYLCASIHCAICMHVTSDGLCTSIHRAGCIHVHLIACVPTPAVPFVCVLHMIVCQHSLLCCSNYLIGIVVAVNCITASVVFLRTLEVLTPWISPFLVTEVMC